MSSITDSEEMINRHSNDSSSFQESVDESEISETDGSSCILMNLDDTRGVSQDSLAAEGNLFNEMKAEVKMAYKDYKISEFVLNTYKHIGSSNRHAIQKLAKFVNDATLSRNLENSIKLKSRNGEIVNLLGLEDCYSDIKNDLTIKEQCQLKAIVLESLKDNIKPAQLEKQCKKEIFAKHYPKQNEDEEDIPCKDKVIRFCHMYNSLEDKIYQLKSVLHQNEITLGQLFEIQHSSEIKEQELKKNSVVLTKLKYMENITSTLKQKANMLLNYNRIRTEYLNTKGKEHEQNVKMLRENINSLKNRIDEYKRKETIFKNYASLVEKYNKTIVDLKGKQQTLCLLNEADSA